MRVQALQVYENGGKKSCVAAVAPEVSRVIDNGKVGNAESFRATVYRTRRS